MKILFDRCYNYLEDDDDFKLGIGGFKHSKGHPWFGFTFILYLINQKFSITYISNHTIYQEVLKKRYPRYNPDPRNNN